MQKTEQKTEMAGELDTGVGEGIVWVPTLTLDELWEGEYVDVDVDGEKVLLAHLPGGRVVAYQGICPHQYIPLADGDLDLDKGILTCTAHHWQFNIHTGEGVNPRGCRLFAYLVRVDGNQILVGYPKNATMRYTHCVAE